MTPTSILRYARDDTTRWVRETAPDHRTACPRNRRSSKRKREGRHLRGTISETLAADVTHFGGDDVTLLKFHGTYQQDDRDARRAPRTEGAEKAYSFMVRVALPAGALDAGQYSRSRRSPTGTPTARCGSPPGRASSSTACSRAT